MEPKRLAGQKMPGLSDGMKTRIDELRRSPLADRDACYAARSKSRWLQSKLAQCLT
jgi:hypothetical protein